MDLVPNHTSDQPPVVRRGPHRRPRQSGTGALHLPATGSGTTVTSRPNNWPSIFGGPRGRGSPSPTARPPVVPAHLRRRAARSELGERRGLRGPGDHSGSGWTAASDGVPASTVAHGMAKPPGLPDMPEELQTGLLITRRTTIHGSTTRASTRSTSGSCTVMDEYPDAVTVGEIWVRDKHAIRRVQSVPTSCTSGSTSPRRGAVHGRLGARTRSRTRSRRSTRAGVPTWTLSNHDVERRGHPLRRGHDRGGRRDRRARAMVLVELALPGTCVPLQRFRAGDAQRRPAGLSSAGSRLGAVGPHEPWSRRVPHPWCQWTRRHAALRVQRLGDDTWLPMPEGWGPLTAGGPARGPSTRRCRCNRLAIELRRTRPEFAGDEVEWYGAPPGMPGLPSLRGPSGVCAEHHGPPVGSPSARCFSRARPWSTVAFRPTQPPGSS